MNYINRNLICWCVNYIQSDPFESIWRNRHMNAFGDSIENVMLKTENPAYNPENKGKKPNGDIENVIFLISSLVATTDCSDKTIKIDLLHAIEAAANKIRFNKDLAHDLDQDLVDALLVDFINFVGVKLWVDFAMYTKDLKQADAPASLNAV